ncbi:MAG: branched-chain amino acid ABC transporter permease [Alphaproteobacteria bacterium]
MYTLDFALQILANGIVIGSVYVLVALGLTLIFGILGIVNFAHGEFYMLGAYFGITAAALYGLSLFPLLLVGILGVVLVGLACERLVFRPLGNQDMTGSIITSFGLAVALQNAALIAFGPQPKLLRTPWANIPVEIGPVFMPLQRALIPVIALVLVVAVHVVLRHTWTGRSLRAMAQHATLAQLYGVDVKRVAVVTFAVGAALAGGAGVLMSSVFLVQPTVGNMIALKAFTVVILGGMGNVYGAVAAGLLLGVAETFVAGYVSNALRDIVGFALVVAVLLVRPQGLFGRALDRA